ncbi:MAG: hypothetical protein JWN06_1298 [Propionibacteriaceae bacterium]|jgi:uncharacterized protein (DUF1800 family)|nr:hypothetical protein [Propionibacteriaceae bacterium]
MTAPQTRGLSRRSLIVGIGATAAVAGVMQAANPSVASAAESDPIMLLLRRATFGPTPALVAEVREQGASAWLDAQLAPTKVPDAAMDTLLKRWTRLGWKTWECRERLPLDKRWDIMYETLESHLARAAWSRRQLLEVTVDFWTNHLVVPVPNGEVFDSSHLFQRDVVRKHALGKYADMLTAAARHPALLNILDNATSSKLAPNENFGRELLELHSVGIGNYTEADVKASALALTGLSTDSESGLYEFKPHRRHIGALKVMGWTHANTSPEGGEAVALSYLSYLARHPATAKRIATKLATRFVADNPPDSLVTTLASVYTSSDTAIAPVLKALFTSDEFLASAGKKIRTPYEDALATIRLLGLGPEAAGTKSLRDLYYATKGMGQAPMGWPAPNGYPDVAAAWSGASGTLARWNFHLGIAGGWTLPTMTRPPLTDLLPKTTPATYGEYVDALASRLLITDLSAAQRTALCAFLDHLPTDKLLSTHAALGWRLKHVVALLLDSPNFATR